MSTTRSSHTRGFTIVELLIVIVVIAILASITVVAYNGVQSRAQDVTLATAARQVVSAVQAFSINEGHLPRGGYGSTVAIGSGTECSDGAYGFFGPVYACSTQDTLVASGYLPTGFSNNLPKNTLYTGDSRYSLMFYVYGTKVMVYYTMRNPSSSDTAHFDAALTDCGLNPAGVVQQRDSWGMRNGICFVY